MSGGFWTNNREALVLLCGYSFWAANRNLIFRHYPGKQTGAMQNRSGVRLLLAMVVTMACGMAQAQDVQRDPVWRALVAGDQAVESGTLSFTQSQLSGRPASVQSHVYSYAPGGLFNNLTVAIAPKAAPFTMGFDGRDAWMNTATGTNLGPKKWHRDWGQGVEFGYSGVGPRASFPMGRGLSFLQNPRVSRANGQITVSGDWVGEFKTGYRALRNGKWITESKEQMQKLKVVARLDPHANFLARTIAVSDANGRPFLFWTTSGVVAGGRIAAASVSRLKTQSGAPVSSFSFSSARFGPLPASTFAPKIHGVNVYDFRVNELHPAFYFGGVPSGVNSQQILADTGDYVEGQNRLQTRNDWRARWAIGGAALCGLALLCGVFAGIGAFWSHRKARLNHLTPTRSRWRGRFVLAGALCAWGFVLAAVGFFKGWTPATLASGRTDVVASQSQIAANASFGSISSKDKRLSSALLATDLKGARARMMKAGAFVGTVSNVRQTRRDDLALDFAPDRSTAMRAVVSPSALSRFPDLQQLIGRKVYVSGALMPHENRAEIVLHAPSQLLLVK